MPFTEIFLNLTGSNPFPWQEAFYRCLTEDERPPQSADLPTGLGKTSVVAIWLIALLTRPDRVPRRLVYVVNRRTVVDQTSAEVERLRERLIANPELLAKLTALCAVQVDVPLALSTLRGQFADNREWCADPARPAVIVGTVDMIGSGLLFSRYTCGFKTRPHHAAFLGQDVLLVHDEAHLEPAFQRLLDSIVSEQQRCCDFRPLKVIELSATARSGGTPFVLTPADEQHEIVSQRLKAAKHLRFTAIEDEKTSLVPKLVEHALAYRDSGRAALIFARSVEAVQKVAAALASENLHCEVLTGTMRGLERDRLIKKPVLSRFLPLSSRPADAESPQEGTCYLIATSAGEVGVNLSADGLICDLSTYESMAQRFGRVNRFGHLTDSVIQIVHPTSFKNTEPEDSKFDPIEAAREHTFALMQQLKNDASPDALRKLKQQLGAQTMLDAFTPDPTIRPATEILFDAWAMTTIREPLPGRPPIAPYLHGDAEWQPPETHVAWREEVKLITTELQEIYPPEDLLSEFPLKPHELLRDRSSRVRAELEQIQKELLKGGDEKAGLAKARNTPIWILHQDGSVEPSNLAYLADKDNEESLHHKTLILPPDLGGLSSAGLLDGKMAPAPGTSLDVGDMSNTEGKPLRLRKFVTSLEEDIPVGLKVLLTIDTLIKEEDLSEDEADESSKPRYWLWLEADSAQGSDRTQSKNAVLLDRHVADAVGHARSIVCKLGLSESLSRCVILAAMIHDLGKRRGNWQRGIGNYDKTVCYAKPGKVLGTKKRLIPRPGIEPYRHEFGSLLDVVVAERLQQQDEAIQHEFTALTEDEKDIVLHLVAAHHGRARPHFPAKESFDIGPDYADVQSVAAEVPQRFARLQRRFGRWGLAYLESLLRSADYAASAEIEPLPLESHE